MNMMRWNACIQVDLKAAAGHRQNLQPQVAAPDIRGSAADYHVAVAAAQRHSVMVSEPRLQGPVPVEPAAAPVAHVHSHVSSLSSGAAPIAHIASRASSVTSPGVVNSLSTAVLLKQVSPYQLQPVLQAPLQDSTTHQVNGAKQNPIDPIGVLLSSPDRHQEPNIHSTPMLEAETTPVRAVGTRVAVSTPRTESNLSSEAIYNAIILLLPVSLRGSLSIPLSNSLNRSNMLI